MTKQTYPKKSLMIILSLLHLSTFINASSSSKTSSSYHAIHSNKRTILAFSTNPATTNAKERLLSIMQRINADTPNTGIFLSDPNEELELKNAVEELENRCAPPSDISRKLMLGDWKLLCTANADSDGTASFTLNTDDLLPFGLPTLLPQLNGQDDNQVTFELPLRPPPSLLLPGILPIQEKITTAIRKSLVATQRIRSVNNEGINDEWIDRVDNVVEFTPLSPSDLLPGGDNSPLVGLLDQLPLNLLEVSKTKITLVHEAGVQSIEPVLRTQTTLQSVVLTVAGNSQYLDPKGADLLSLNVPLIEFLNSGSFDTTYVDEDIRVSRGTVGLLDQILVFSRKGSSNVSSNPAAASAKISAAESAVAATKSYSGKYIDYLDSLSESSSPSEQNGVEMEEDDKKKSSPFYFATYVESLSALNYVDNFLNEVEEEELFPPWE